MPRVIRVSQNTRKRASEPEQAHVSSQGASQSSGSRRRRQVEDDDDDYDERRSQSQAKNTLSKEELERKVADFVRYMLFMDGKKTTVKRADITKNVMKEHSRSFAAVLPEAQRKMKKTFGYELVETDHNKQKSYILVNSMASELRQIVQSDAEELPKMGLLLVILAMIFMKDNVLAEDVLWQTLKRLGIFKGKIHDTFGDVDKLITVEFVRQMYLDRKKIVTNDSTAAFEYRWGARAENEITKRQTLQVVANVYGTDLESWTAKYKEVVKAEQYDAS